MSTLSLISKTNAHASLGWLACSEWLDQGYLLNTSLTPKHRHSLQNGVLIWELVNSLRGSQVHKHRWTERRDPSAGLKLRKQIPVQCPGKLVFWLKFQFQGDQRFLGYALLNLGPGGETREGSHVLKSKLWVTFLIFLFSVSLLLSLSGPPSEHLLKSHLFTFTIITLDKPLLSLTYSTRLPPSTKFLCIFSSCFLILTLCKR